MLRTGCSLRTRGLVILIAVQSECGVFLCTHRHLLFRFHFLGRPHMSEALCQAYGLCRWRASGGHSCHPAQAQVTLFMLTMAPSHRLACPVQSACVHVAHSSQNPALVTSLSPLELFLYLELAGESCGVWGPWPLSSACLSRNLCCHSLERSASAVRLIIRCPATNLCFRAFLNFPPSLCYFPASPHLSVVGQV